MEMVNFLGRGLPSREGGREGGGERIFDKLWVFFIGYMYIY
jgi:hypothetical protein